ncbi:hypothetical protein EV182_002785 [Spiromyces aspiralis]|uniref:Uncharacterized protein n=1 Tax=Spiromyces aspiralis TaxID=68401 RepID=A0ACC1HS07_9FUNG|nr:hypothetical protein EV182_002785 [Spiromyces aspiralis]
MSALVKANSNSGFPSLEIVFFRSLIQLVGAVIGALIAGVNPLGPPNSELRGWLMLRGFIGGLGIIAFFSSVTILPLADANVVFFTNPILTSLIAHYILGEDYSLTDKALSFVCMLGVVLVSKPSTLFTLSSPYFAATTTTAANTASDVLPASSDAGGSIMRALGVAVAFVGALCAASAYTLVRKIGKNVHFTVQVTYLGLVCTVMSGIPLLFSIQSFHLPASLNDWSMLVSVGLCAVFSQMLLNRGLQLAPAGPAILMRNLDVVFAYVFSVAVFNEIPDIMSIVGSTVIIGCTVALGPSQPEA